MAEAKVWQVDVTEVEKRKIFSATALSLGTALAIASTAHVSDNMKKILLGCGFGFGLISIASALSEPAP